MEPKEAQYLVINALQTLELLLGDAFDSDDGVWYIRTPSPVLPIARLMPDGEITQFEEER